MNVNDASVATEIWINSTGYLRNLPSTANFTTLKVNDVDVLTALPSVGSFSSLTISSNAVATESCVNGKGYLTILPSTANFTTLTVSNVHILTALSNVVSFTSLTIGSNSVATESWVSAKNYLTTIPSTANFTSLTVGNSTVATQAYADANLASARSYTEVSETIAMKYIDDGSYISPSILVNKTLTGNFNILKVNAVGVLTALPSTTSFTTLTIGTDNVTTEFYAGNKAKAYADAGIVLAKAYMDDANFVSPTTISNKTLTGNFSILRVNDVDVLSTLPSIASFITLTIGLNAVATQVWVTSQIYLTRTIVSNKMVNGNSSVLKVNDVSTNSFTEYSKFYNIDYRT